MEASKKKFHYAWLIFISCCCFSAGGLSLATGAVGVYMLPICQDLGVERGVLALWITVMGVTRSLALPLQSRLFQTKNLNVVMTVSSMCMVVGLVGFAFSSSVWMFYGFAILLGFGLATLFVIACPVLISNWFAPKYRGKMLGIASAFSGVGTFVWAPLFATLIQNFGWQTSYLVNAAIAAVLLLPVSMFVVKLRPEDKGLLPYGYDPAEATAEGQKSLGSGMSASQALKTTAFWVLLIGVMCCACGAGFNNNQSGIAIERLIPVGYEQSAAAMVGATMISFAAAGNALGKITFGFLSDKIGIRPTFMVFIIMFGAAFVMFLFSTSSVMLIAAGFLLGTHNALVSVGFPLLVRNVFGGRDYANIWSYIAMPFTLLGSFGTAFIGFLYAINGNYYIPLYFGVGIVVVIAFAVFVGSSFVGKYNDKWKTPEEAEAEKAKG